MKKVNTKRIFQKLLCIAVVAVFFVLAAGSGNSKKSLTPCYICEEYGADNVVEAIDTYYLCDDCYDDFLEIKYSKECYICGGYGADNVVGSYDICDDCYSDLLSMY